MTERLNIEHHLSLGATWVVFGNISGDLVGLQATDSNISGQNVLPHLGKTNEHKKQISKSIFKLSGDADEGRRKEKPKR